MTEFANKLDTLLRQGARPDGGGKRWFSSELANAIGASERTIRNWRTGRSTPSNIEPILEALFGDSSEQQNLRDELRRAWREARSSVAARSEVSKTSINNVPARVPAHFVGRDRELEFLDRTLLDPERKVPTLTISGMGGLGKSALAAAFAESRRGSFDVIWWIRAQSASTTRTDLVALGTKLGWIDATQTEEEALPMIVERLQEGERTLLIFDDAMTGEDIANYLPRGGKVAALVTSRSHNWRRFGEVIPLSTWPVETAASYLVARSGRLEEREAALELSALLGGLPLAHELAAAYCERLGVSLAEFKRRFENAPTRFLNDPRNVPQEYHQGQTIAKALELAIENARRQNSNAVELISYAALLPAGPIPLLFLREAEILRDQDAQAENLSEEFDEACATLLAFALISREDVPETSSAAAGMPAIRLHPIVREFVNESLSPEYRNTARRALIAALKKVFPSETFEDPTTWPLARLLLPLASSLLLNADGTSEPRSQDGTLLAQLAKYVTIAVGDWSMAEELFGRALAAFEKEGSRSGISAALNNLALLRRGQGNLSEARYLLERSLSIQEMEGGSGHPEFVTSLCNLGSVLMDAGDRAAAHALYERALAISEASAPSHEPRNALIVSNLGRLAHEEGRFAKARALYERALALYRITLGPDHPNTAALLSNLGSIAFDQGDVAQAWSIYREALAIYEHSLGSGHPNIAVVLANLGAVSSAIGEWKEAQIYWEQALAIFERAFPPDNPQISMTLCNLAFVFEALGEIDRARLSYERALMIEEAAAGARNSSSADILSRLARLRASQGDLVVSQKLTERAKTVPSGVLDFL